MSLFASPLISLFFSGFALAGLVAPDCSTTWSWSFNSLGQNACTVAAYLLSTCHGGSFTVDALPSGYHYAGPYLSQGADSCLCNTVAYSLLSACDGCQGSDWISWSNYSYNCTKVLPPSSFPNPIPSGTRLQHWALLDITVDNNWSSANCKAAGDNPELGPGAIVGAAGASTGGPFPSSTLPLLTTQPPVDTSTASLSRAGSSNTSSSVPAGFIGGHKSNAGAIAGGTVAAIAAISIIVVGLFFYRQRQRRSLAQSAPPSTGVGQVIYNPQVIQVPTRPTSGQATVTSSLPGADASLLRPYNPEDPSTFPGYQGLAASQSFTSAQSPSLSNSRNLYTVATPPSHEAQGYGG